MTTPCTPHKLELEPLGRRRVDIDFSAGNVSSDGGGILLAEADRRLGLSERLAGCFTDFRNADLVEHSVGELLRQRIFGLALGYEDLNDHDALSRDPLFAMLVGKTDPTGQARRNGKDLGHALAGASTLGRIERSKESASKKTRYEKVVCDFEKVADLFVDLYIERQAHAPSVLVLDLDPSDIELHGEQEERFYQGYYREYCYLPMYLFAGDFPLAAMLRPANIDGAAGSVEMLMRVIARLRAAWSDVRIILRGDSGFAREELMSWCELNDIDFVFGLARNSRLERCIATQMEQARRECLRTGKAARRFRSFEYRTRKTWQRKRRVVGKAEYTTKGANPRFIVTSLPACEYEKGYLYEDVYCARGEMENRIKEEQLDLFGDRASCHSFRGNALRVWLSAAAHLLITELRRLALGGTELARAQASTLRVRLFKIGALTQVSVRRVYIRLSSAFPLRELLALALQRLRSPPCPA